ncbi:uncharacterized protein BDR25DRAFT_346619 [Lindgomyces ingoldianus]|uniref:Uncharacterized protein n=1 Tax=Lindgomyces ingoldianus TaxID=673940 RepID=A0ACB6QCA3_9PLEO|nr:uncharacterized protein BDR25DRAFT_346619 [Lindgomyces ingoldianus]KAF2464593.1 hypothetical protein BDR25DRAFT_346619 [Lindgomyces ingoldianus]
MSHAYSKLVLVFLSRIGFANLSKAILNSTTSATKLDAGTSLTGFPSPATNTTNTNAAIQTSSRANSHFKLHAESSVTGFESEGTEPPRSLKESSAIQSSTSEEDVGAVLTRVFNPSGYETYLVHVESTESGFGPTPHIGVQNPETTIAPGVAQSGKGSHLESTAAGLGENNLITSLASGTTPAPLTPPPVTLGDQILIPVLITTIVISGTTLLPGGTTATLGYGSSTTAIYVDLSGHPVIAIGSLTTTMNGTPSGQITVDGQVLTLGGSPVTIGSGDDPTTFFISPGGETIVAAHGVSSTLFPPATQSFTIGTFTVTAIADYQYTLGPETLLLGHPITMDGTVISLATDSAGSTVLIIGGSSTTTLPVAPQTMSSNDLSIFTTVVSGATEYIIGSQTLYPGHPITIHGTAISIITSSSATMLVIGTLTTTISPKPTISSPVALTYAGKMTLTNVASIGTGNIGGWEATATSTRAKSGAGRTMKIRDNTRFILSGMLVILGYG